MYDTERIMYGNTFRHKTQISNDSTVFLVRSCTNSVVDLVYRMRKELEDPAKYT